MDITSVNVEFTICSSELDHNKITDVLGIKPNYIRYKDEVLNNGRLFGYDVWGIETENEPSLDIRIQLAKITETLFGKAELINDICEKFNAKCSFVIVIQVENGEFPAMILERGFMKFATSINAEVEFDSYFFS